MWKIVPEWEQRNGFKGDSPQLRADYRTRPEWESGLELPQGTWHGTLKGQASCSGSGRAERCPSSEHGLGSR